MIDEPKPLKSTLHYLLPDNYWMACGKLTINETHYYTKDPQAVTCKACRRTKLWKRERYAMH